MRSTHDQRDADANRLMLVHERRVIRGLFVDVPVSRGSRPRGSVFWGMLALDPRVGIGWFDWLATSSHRLAEVTAGRVFHDDLRKLVPLREAFAHYAHEVWLFILASSGAGCSGGSVRRARHADR